MIQISNSKPVVRNSNLYICLRININFQMQSCIRSNIKICCPNQEMCINTNISHHLFDFTITKWIHSTRTQIQKVNLYSGVTGFKHSISGIQNKSESKIIHFTPPKGISIGNCYKWQSKICHLLINKAINTLSKHGKDFPL